ncbi:MAG: hypothetical protein RLZZ600_785 [Actinomycetota bacterium]|jgi:leader peptidase (prepilin peptidase)/N-methyltransferase
MSWAGWVLCAYIALVTAPLTVIDVRVHRLPNRLVVPGLALAALCGAWEWGSSGWTNPRPLLCGALYFAFMLVLGLLGGLGMGDVKLAGVLGVASGFLGWQSAVASLMLAFIFGGLVALGLWIAKRRGRIPFGPFMLAGFWASTTIALFKLVG